MVIDPSVPISSTRPYFVHLPLFRPPVPISSTRPYFVHLFLFHPPVPISSTRPYFVHLSLLHLPPRLSSPTPKTELIIKSDTGPYISPSSLLNSPDLRSKCGSEPREILSHTSRCAPITTPFKPNHHTLLDTQPSLKHSSAHPDISTALTLAIVCSQARNGFVSALKPLCMALQNVSS